MGPSGTPTNQGTCAKSIVLLDGNPATPATEIQETAKAAVLQEKRDRFLERCLGRTSDSRAASRVSKGSLETGEGEEYKIQ
jgi:hypothetical protein